MIDDPRFYRGSDEVVPVSILQAEVENFEHAAKIFCGIPTLDEVLEFFELGEIAVLSGPPGSGKTSFARFLITKFAELGYKCLYFGKEGGVGNFFKKFPHPLPNFYMSREFIRASIEWLEERIIEGKEKFGVNIVFIDHLHYILDISQLQKENTSLFIGVFMRKLVDLAKKHSVLIFLLCHTKKETFSGLHNNPTPGDIRDSSFIVGECDILLFVWRLQRMDKTTGEVEFLNNQCKLSVQKNKRAGILKTIKMIYDNGLFKEDDGLGNYQW